MAVERMQLINVIGNYGDFDRVVAKYILSSDIHLENAFDVFHNMRGLYPYIDENPYSDVLAKMSAIAAQAGVETEADLVPCEKIDAAKIERYAAALTQTLENIKTKHDQLTAELSENQSIIKQLEPIRHITIELDNLFHFHYIKVRFGHMPKDSFVQLYSYLGDYNTFFFKLDENEDTVFGVYFAPATIFEKIDSIFASLYFERVRISDKAAGVPENELARIQEENQRIQQHLADLEQQKQQIFAKEKKDIIDAYNEIRYVSEVYDARRYAAHTNENFYIVGWAPDSALPELTKKLELEPTVTFLVESAKSVHGLSPPTKLKNNFIFQPFKGFVKMYGIPNYDEIDPTTIFAITYTLMFGIMYGDIGHGVVLSLFGLYMDKVKKSFIGGILLLAGISSVFFGFMYGSIFGFEHIYEGLWYKPLEGSTNMTNTLLYAVALGAVFMSLAMILNMVNQVKRREFGELIFSPNGIVGFMFFWALILAVVLTMLGYTVLTPIYVLPLIVLPIIALFMKEPLIKLVEGEKDWLPKKFGAFFIETFFEMFETLLSYVSNLISFVRVGAYALIHAGMLSVVMLFVESMNGAASVAMWIAGNFLVIGMEGLLVAIQVLRLEFYEMFSRFYKGNGKEFQPRRSNR